MSVPMCSRYARDAIDRLDRVLHALFAHRTDDPRHDRDREHHRGAALAIDFDTYMTRTYGVSWLVAICATAVTVGSGRVLSPALVVVAADIGATVVPSHEAITAVPNHYIVGSVSIAIGVFFKRVTVATSGRYLRWRANARRAAIERSLPGAVRYLGALAAGSKGQEAMLRNVAERDVYGETGRSFGRVLEAAAVTGSLNTGLRTVARETPSREILSPFLLKFREHASQGSDSLREFLQMESRMLSHQRSRARRRAGSRLKLVARLFIVVLALPASLVVAITVTGGLPADPSQPISILGRSVNQATLFHWISALIIGGGGGTALLLATLRPSTHDRSYDRPGGLATLATATTNPASATVAFAIPALAIGWFSWTAGQPLLNVVLFGYAALGFPVGVVAVKREQRDDAKDREMRDLVHAITGHVRLGKPFEEAVEMVAREIDFGPLGADVDDLAFRLGLTTGTAEMDTRREALERFAERAGTPLAEQSVGLVIGTLDVGSDPGAAFETLQTEVGVLYHQRKELQSAMLVHVAIGWLTALLVVALLIGSHIHAFGTERDAWQLQLVAQSTMLACGWFAGTASRGRHEALLHSSALVVACHVAFAGAGLP
jgi:archaellum biogenesis protein FlaJ (TadC family)